MNQELEHILCLDKQESASSKSMIVANFLDQPCTPAELATFFQWLANELDKGEIEFNNLVFTSIKLNKSSARLLSIWLFRIVS